MAEDGSMLRWGFVGSPEPSTARLSYFGAQFAQPDARERSVGSSLRARYGFGTSEQIDYNTKPSQSHPSSSSSSSSSSFLVVAAAAITMFAIARRGRRSASKGRAARKAKLSASPSLYTTGRNTRIVGLHAEGSSSGSRGAQRDLCYLHLMGPAEKSLLEEFRGVVEDLVEKTGQRSIWGVSLSSAEDEASDIVLFKFLRAANLNLDEARSRLEKTLRFRAQENVNEMRSQPLEPHFRGHDTLVGQDIDGRPVMVSRYGKMDNDKVFGNLEGFLKYRTQVMESAVAKLPFKKGAPEDLCQVHDYSGVPLLFKTNEVKNCVNAMSKLFGDHYPELKGTTIFVNFPMTFSKLFQAFSMFLPERTRKKFMIFGESEQALLFKYIRPETVPEDLGGLLRATDEDPGEQALQTEVPAGEVREVLLAQASGPATLEWDVRCCAQEASYEIFFVPAAGGNEKKVVQDTPLEASSGGFQDATRRSKQGCCGAASRMKKLGLPAGCACPVAAV
eukprot:CAMPEP_0206619808 /NCGR_PEP_ID=MMETSP0325_2-20121206/61112_1 /ASSEMBLY_ACC=CAM_ASM_000347 /TAXON_ID=2866 /ORGANISM="Crypthecodinium cohnii, Strain Seligo" /LENGTH=503 /DNA_ID=CAMNT_0054142375 /DNA_START=39 /DNA_END=1551 /DNA_ORIENTATION=+